MLGAGHSAHAQAHESRDAWATTSISATTTTVSGAGTATRYDWTAGAGLEYAFDNHWSGFVEYDHLGFLTQLVNPTIYTVPPLAATSSGAVTAQRNIGLNIDRASLEQIIASSPEADYRTVVMAFPTACLPAVCAPVH